jgi:hypothetical protein
MQDFRTNAISHLAGGRVTFRPLSSWLAVLLAAFLGLAACARHAGAEGPMLRTGAPQRMAQDEGWAPVRSTGTTADTDLAVDYLWVLRNSLIHAEDIPRIIERAKRMHVRGLLVQVIGRGDAWYRSDLLPRPEPLQGADRDPLGELLPLAHAAGLEVHAWVNCCRWSATFSAA